MKAAVVIEVLRQIIITLRHLWTIVEDFTLMHARLLGAVDLQRVNGTMDRVTPL